ncbi:hypothetical protein [Streptomyces broussonetiae]|uniref:hypothetical protein n=1 Tax=Streptomyces broussonetiae TaxID=2686304 RepID=UPI001E325D08|nr:hypothetical protein [Streptomyces broussonetiae]
MASARSSASWTPERAHVVVPGGEDLPARIKEITGGEGVRLAFDPIAGPGVKTIARGIARARARHRPHRERGPPRPEPEG